jgi:hypothetical protein
MNDLTSLLLPSRGVSESPLKAEIVGLNLLFLIVENRMGAFHSEVRGRGHVYSHPVWHYLDDGLSALILVLYSYPCLVCICMYMDGWMDNGCLDRDALGGAERAPLCGLLLAP